MRKTKFSLIVSKTPLGFKYSGGFKNISDAEQFVSEYGGVAEHVDCVFYDDIDDARKHQLAITEANNQLREVSKSLHALDDDVLTQWIDSSPELIEKLKRIMT